MSLQDRLPFELDDRIDETLATAHAGVPLAIELFHSCGASGVLEQRVVVKQRKRGLTEAQITESFFALWIAGGERCEDLERLREDRALAQLLGHEIPSVTVGRDFLSAFHEEDLPLLQAGEKATVPAESEPLAGLAAVSGRIVTHLQQLKPSKTATLDLDATILQSDKRAAKPTYDGRRGYQPALVLWAEQDMIVADEFRDGNVPAGSGNLRVLKKALDALPAGVEEVLLRSDSAAYEHELMEFAQAKGIGFAISAKMSPELHQAITALPEAAWQTDAQQSDALRQWAEVEFFPEESRSPQPYRYLGIRVLKQQGDLFADGTDRRHFCIVTNRDGDGRELIRWHRGKAGTIEHAHDILTNELAAEALPSQKFGANAAWVRLNVIAYNLLTLLKRTALPEEFKTARPKALRFLLFNTVGRVIHHARETLLRLSSALVRALFDAARVKIHAQPPPLVAV
jgi:Transposase DDE domain group 1